MYVKKLIRHFSTDVLFRKSFNSIPDWQPAISSGACLKIMFFSESSKKKLNKFKPNSKFRNDLLQNRSVYECTHSMKHTQFLVIFIDFNFASTSTWMLPCEIIRMIDDEFYNDYFCSQHSKQWVIVCFWN